MGWSGNQHRLELRPWKRGRNGGKSLGEIFLAISGYAYPEVRHEVGFHSVLMRMHELQLELRWFVASIGRPMVGQLRGELWLEASVLPPSVVVTTYSVERYIGLC